METLALYTLISTALWYLGSRALITRWLWENYHPTLARFMDCPACVGFWHGLLLTITLGRVKGVVPFGLDTHLDSAIVVGLCSIVMTAICAGLMQHMLMLVGNVAVDDDLDDN
jgi:hypothetical protein